MWRCLLFTLCSKNVTSIARFVTRKDKNNETDLKCEIDNQATLLWGKIVWYMMGQNKTKSFKLPNYECK